MCAILENTKRHHIIFFYYYLNNVYLLLNSPLGTRRTSEIESANYVEFIIVKSLLKIKRALLK